MEKQDFIGETLLEFVVDYCEYLPEYIPALDKFPTPNKFLSEYVIANLPFIVRGEGTEPLPAVLKWNDPEYMNKKMSKRKVTVAVTPNGRADSIVDDRFMLPEERTMEFGRFQKELSRHDLYQVYYLQKQNNNLIEEFSPLVCDVGPDVPWATEAFANPPDAVNIWMGDKRSATSTHKDNYENLYYVITGQKQFKLYPPVSICWMPYKKYPKFQWHYEGMYKKDGMLGGTWNMTDLNEEVKWIDPSRKPETLRHFTLWHNVMNKYYLVLVNPGDMLYIPALWFHEVRQSDRCIAVNYWYDMKYDMKYPFFKLLEKLCTSGTPRRSVSVDKQDELELSLLSDLFEKQGRVLDEELEKRPK